MSARPHLARERAPRRQRPVGMMTDQGHPYVRRWTDLYYAWSCSKIFEEILDEALASLSYYAAGRVPPWVDARDREDVWRCQLYSREIVSLSASRRVH